MLYTKESLKNFGHLQNVYALHAVETLLSKRKAILKQNEKMSRSTAEGKAPEPVKDQGFARPSVLIILPMRNSAFDVVEAILALSGRSKIENKARFMDDFAPSEEELQADESKPGTVH